MNILLCIIHNSVTPGLSRMGLVALLALTPAAFGGQFVLAIRETGTSGEYELRINNLEPGWTCQLQENADLVSPWVTVSGSLKTNVTEAVWTVNPPPGETRRFFRVIKTN